jgi:two-component system, OmpR family, response regulator
VLFLSAKIQLYTVTIKVMKLLLVEDEPKLGAAIKRGLEQDGYAVDLVDTAEDGLSYAQNDEYDLLILDRMLPGGKDGLDICRTLRKSNWQGAILMLTARGELSDRVTGLHDGADDYLTKPFAFDELLARIQALLRRPNNLVGPKLVAGSITIDLSAKKVVKEGAEVRLTKREFALLEYLAHNKNTIVSKDQIVQHVWDFDADILPNTVEVFIRTLRKKLHDENGELIETVRGFGYRLQA